MSVTVNGTALKDMTYNGNTVKKWVHEGVTVWQRYSDSSAIVMAYNPGDVVWVSGTVTIPLSKKSESGTAFSASGSNIKVNHPVRATISLAMGFNGRHGGAVRFYIYVNGTVVSQYNGNPATEAWLSYTLTYTGNLKEGDIIKITFYGAGGGTNTGYYSASLSASGNTIWT